MPSWHLVKYILTAAIRDRLILAFVLLMAVGTSMAIFLGSAAITESDRFAVVFAAGGLRFAGVAGLVLFIVFYLRRAFESKDVEFMLSRPVGRLSFLLSHFIAFTILSAVLSALVFGALYAVDPHNFGQGYWLWLCSLFAEYVIVGSTAMFFAMVLNSAAGCAMAVFGFYVLARIIGQILGTMTLLHSAAEFDILNSVMNIVALIIPRLDLMAQTTWLVYGPDQIGYGFILAQGVIFSAMVVLAALVDLMKRQF